MSCSQFCHPQYILIIDLHFFQKKRKKKLAFHFKRRFNTNVSFSCFVQMQKREEKLRKQLSEASQRIEKQNEKFDSLEEKLRTTKDSNESLEKANKENKQKVSSLQVIVHSSFDAVDQNVLFKVNVYQLQKISVFLLQDEITSTKKELASIKSDSDDTVIDLKTQVANLKEKVKNLEEEMEKKDTRLKSMSSRIEELLTKMETERTGYELALLGNFLFLKTNCFCALGVTFD